MTKLPTFAVLALCAGLACAPPAHADVVTDWNAVTVLYVSTGGPGTPQVPPVGRGGPPGLLDIALVHLAMHDAIQAIERKFDPYHYTNRRAFRVGNPAAAAAAAAHRVLVLLYPGQQTPLDTFYNNYLATHGLAGDPGLAVGEAAGVALHANHYRPTLVVDPFIGGTGIGEWRPVPPTGATTPMAFQFLAVTEPFTLRRQSQFRPPPPPPLKSRQYAREYNEVKQRGNAAAHPNAETDMGLFWSGNFFAQWNETLRQLADANITDIGDSARLFALANVAAADAAIAVWDTKIHYNAWRPTTAIHEGDNDGNSRTAGDVTWQSLLPVVPNYPDHSSGANGVTAAFASMARLFFGTDKMSFSVKNPNPAVSDKEREFTRFSQAMDEVVDARIILGIHFRFADEDARVQGSRVAHWTFHKILGPRSRHGRW
jgi:hypothetical protein